MNNRNCLLLVVQLLQFPSLSSGGKKNLWTGQPLASAILQFWLYIVQKRMMDSLQMLSVRCLAGGRTRGTGRERGDGRVKGGSAALSPQWFVAFLPCFTRKQLCASLSSIFKLLESQNACLQRCHSVPRQWTVFIFSFCIIPQGRITVTGLLDREKGDTYTLTVVADDGGPKKDSTVVCLFCLLLFLGCAHSRSYVQCRITLCVFCYRKLKGIPLLFIASLIGSAEGKTFSSFFERLTQQRVAFLSRFFVVVRSRKR